MQKTITLIGCQGEQLKGWLLILFPDSKNPSVVIPQEEFIKLCSQLMDKERKIVPFMNGGADMLGYPCLFSETDYNWIVPKLQKVYAEKYKAIVEANP